MAGEIGGGNGLEALNVAAAMGPYEDAQDRLLWKDKTCPVRT